MIARTNDNKSYDKVLIWSPVLAGLLLPIITPIAAGHGFLGYLISDPFVIVRLLIGAVIISVPFGLASILTKQDLERDLAYRKILIRWLVCFLPVLAWFLFLLFSMIISSVKGLPGASTSPIALVTVPIFGVPVVLLSHWTIDKLQER